MLRRCAFGSARDRLSQSRAVQPQVAADLDPIDRDARVLANDHVFVTAQLDRFDVMGENAFGHFESLCGGGFAYCVHHIPRNLLERLDVQIAANILDQRVETVLDFHKAAATEASICVHRCPSVNWAYSPDWCGVVRVRVEKNSYLNMPIYG